MLEIQEINNPEQWNQFLLKLKPNTFLQSAEWGQLQAKHAAEAHYLGIYKNGSQIGAGLVLIINAKRGRFLFCPHGPIFANEAITRACLPVFFKYCGQLAQQKQAVAVRIAPLLLTTPANTALFKSAGFRPAPLHIHSELTWMLDLASTEEKLLQNMRKTTRQAIRRALDSSLAAEVITAASAIDRLWPLYQETKTRHSFIPFSKKFLRDQFEIFSKNNRAYAIIVRHENKDVAAGLFMQFGNTVFYHHGASTKLPAVLPSSHLVQWRSIQEAKKHGAERYNFWGIATANKPRHPFAGITVFKTGFGGYALDYMHTQDLPLNWKYWKLWAIETYRKLKRGF